MNFSIFIFICTVLKMVQCHPYYRCPPGEVWSECVVPCNTCRELGQCDSQTQCQSGCDCKPGSFRDETGRCVPEYQCEERTAKCPANSVFAPCVSACSATCENPFGTEYCEEECAPGCQCKQGFLRREDGKCVLPRLCNSRQEISETCKEDEDYYECTPSCKNTCENFNNPGVRCRCGPAGCFCREGLVKRSDGLCVRPHKCSQRVKPESKCPENAILIECGSPCPPTCDDPEPQACEQKCITACYCKPGYLKRKDEKCVLPHQCNSNESKFPKCPKNAIFIECGSPCPPSCANRHPEPCAEKCVAACFCKPGFLPREDGTCVPPQQCTKEPSVPAPVCPENSEYISCGSACAPNCESPNTDSFCKDPCVAGCFCKPGYLKNNSGVCIPPEACERRCHLPEEEFVECGTPCPDTCDSLEKPHPYLCSKRCIKGCFCKKGLFRAKDGKCVLAKDCLPMYSTTTTQSLPYYTSNKEGASEKIEASRGCPNRTPCDAFCKTKGIFIGVCIGPGRATCRCV